MDIEFIEADDWTELVVDGKRVYGNHSIRPKELLNLLGIQYKTTYIEGEEEFFEYLETKEKAY